MSKYSNDIENIFSKKRELWKLQKEFINKVFDERGDTVGIPKWLHTAVDSIDANCDFNLIYADYNHDGAWVRPFSMTRTERDKDEYSYSFCGRENEEYADEWQDDLYVFSLQDISQFLIDYLDSNFDDKLEELVKNVIAQHSMSDAYITIEEWAEEYGYDIEDIDQDKCFEWCGMMWEKMNDNEKR